MEQQTIQNTDYDLATLNIQFDDFESETLYYGDPTGSCSGELNYTIPGSTIFEDNGKHAPAAVSTNSLPLGVAVEIDAIFEIE